MLTSDDFDIAATELESASSGLAAAAAQLGALLGPDALRGGRLSSLVDQVLTTGSDTGLHLAEHLDRQADLCRRRAAILRAYERALLVHHQQVDLWREAAAGRPAGSPPPPRPQAPARPVFTP